MTDAIWQPMRGPDWASEHGPRNLWRARVGFPTGGVEWIPHGTAASREHTRRVSERLIASGQVRRLPSGGVLLSDGAEARARGLIDLPCAAESWLGTNALLAFGPPRSWICETVLIRNDPTADYDRLGRNAGKLLSANESSFLPALSRGYALSASDADGRVFLSSTAAGAKWARGPAPRLPPAVEPQSEALDVYLAARSAAREEMRTAPGDLSELGMIPLPTSGALIRGPDGATDAPRRCARKGARRG